MEESRFALIERQGYSEREIAEADDLETILEQLGEKTGMFEIPEVEP